MLLLVVTGCSNTLITKSFASSTLVTDENSFFLFTNVFLELGGTLVFLLEGLDKFDFTLAPDSPAYAIGFHPLPHTLPKP